MEARKPCTDIYKGLWSNICQYNFVAQWIYLKQEGETKMFADERTQTAFSQYLLYWPTLVRKEKISLWPYYVWWPWKCNTLIPCCWGHSWHQPPLRSSGWHCACVEPLRHSLVPANDGAWRDGASLWSPLLRRAGRNPRSTEQELF